MPAIFTAREHGQISARHHITGLIRPQPGQAFHLLVVTADVEGARGHLDAGHIPTNADSLSAEIYITLAFPKSADELRQLLIPLPAIEPCRLIIMVWGDGEKIGRGRFRGQTTAGSYLGAVEFATLMRRQHPDAWISLALSNTSRLRPKAAILNRLQKDGAINHHELTQDNESGQFLSTFVSTFVSNWPRPV